MKTKKKGKLLEIGLTATLLILVFSQYGYSALSVYLEGSGILLTIPNGSTISFGDESHGATLTVTSGTVNGTVSLTYWREKGKVSIASTDTAEFVLSGYGERTSLQYNGQIVENVNASYLLGSTVSGNSFYFGWAVKTEPLLPVMFILGMVGLFTFIGGLLWACVNFREGEYVEGLRVGVIFCSIGFGLVWGWLGL